MLKTEMRNENTMHIDQMSTIEMMQVMQNENMNAARAVGEELEAIGTAVDAIAARMKEGGRLFYVGCGTSGRLGVLDASECPPTYGVPYDLVQGMIAGGFDALVKAGEGAEDSFDSGYLDLKVQNLTAKDSVVGISVAGGAAYVLGAFSHAKEVGALTIGLSCNRGSRVDTEGDISICPDTGAEVITGSTRMKAGSAHKMILNMISTGVMIRLGHVYENLMINLRPTNIKLKNRMIRIVSDITGLDSKAAEKLLEENDYVIRKAVRK